MKKEEKVKLIKDYANTLGICRTCLRREAEKDKTRCIACIGNDKRSEYARRRRVGHCSKCGNFNPQNSTHKTCAKCRLSSRNQYLKRICTH